MSWQKIIETVEKLHRWGKIAGDAVEGVEEIHRLVNGVRGDCMWRGVLWGPSDFHVIPLHLDLGVYEVLLTQPFLTDFNLFVLNGQGEVVAQDTSNHKTSSVVVKGSGPCFVCVVSAHGVGEYSLSVKRHC